MDALLLIARLALAAVFMIAGIGKLLDLKGSQKAVRDFGVPSAYAGPIGLALPIAEIAIAIALIWVDAARYGAIAALFLLLGFIGGIVWNLRQGKTPDCHCFGQLHSEPAGPKTLIRNGVLAAVAVFVLVAGWNDPGYALLGWIDNLSGFEWAMLIFGVVLLAGLLGIGWLVMNMLGQNGRLLLRIDELEQQLEAVAAGGTYQAVAAPARQEEPAPHVGLPLGDEAPSFRLKGIHGETMSLDALLAAEKPVLLIFSDPGCGPCTALMPTVAGWQQEHSDTFLTAVLSRGSLAANKEKAREHGIGMMLLQENREIADAYQTKGTPSAVIVGPDGRIASSVAGGAEKIRDLVRTLTHPAPAQANGRVAAPANGAAAAAPAQHAAPRPAQTPDIGSVAPDAELTDLDGNAVNLTDLFERDSVLIFWSPTCGFCSRMIPDLLEWEKAPGEDAPQAIIITSGDIEANRKAGFKSIVLHDAAAQTMRLYGSSGTPSAIGVDSEGKVSSNLRIGQPGVMSLLRNEPMPQAPAAPKPVGIGDPAPRVVLPDLNGDEFDLASKKGDEVAVIFWNPGCGFCSRMIEDLKAWLSDQPEEAPDLVLVSTGTAEANAAQYIDATILIDQGFRVGRSFGASGTPSAVLIDAEGKVASAVAVGAPGVFDLIGKPKVAQS